MRSYMDLFFSQVLQNYFYRNKIKKLTCNIRQDPDDIAPFNQFCLVNIGYPRNDIQCKHTGGNCQKNQHYAKINFLNNIAGIKNQ